MEKGKLCLVGQNYEQDDGGTWSPCFEGCLSQDVSTGIHPRDGSAPVLTTTSHQCASHYTHGMCTGDWCSGALVQTPGHAQTWDHHRGSKCMVLCCGNKTEEFHLQSPGPDT